MITIKLDVTKLQKERFYHGKKGIYAELVLIEHENDYGDDGFVAQSVTKQERDAGERGPIVGNWRELQKKESPAPRQAFAGPQRPPPDPQRDLPIEDDDIPF